MTMKNLFRTVGILEALSFLILLGIAMPLKYMMDMPEATRHPGMIHGVLFLAYIALAFQRSDAEDWPKQRLTLALVASVLPFGTLVFDRKYLRD